MAPGAGPASEDAPLPDPAQAFRERAARDRRKTGRLMAELTKLGWARAAPPLAELESLAHGLAGAGGTFGFPELSETAARVERRLEGWRRAAPAPLSPRQIAGLRRLVERMAAELDVAARDGDAPGTQAPMPPR